MKANRTLSLIPIVCLLTLITSISVFGGSIEITSNLVDQKTFECFEKVEFEILLNKCFADPFNTGDEEVFLEITKPNGKIVKLPAFWIQKFDFKMRPLENRNYEWLYPEGNARWFARYAGDIEGEYSATAVYNSPETISRSSAIKFKCSGGDKKGFIRVSKTNQKYLEYDNGTPFFPIGLNLAFVGFGQYLSYEKLTNIFAKMNENGANYARIWACCEDWALGIEARKSAFSRSYSWYPPFINPPGNENYHSQKLAIQIGGDRPAVLDINPSEQVGVKPNHKYLLSGKVMGEDGNLIIESGNKELGEPIAINKKSEWITFSREFMSTSNQWWLDNLRLRSGNGKKILIKDITLQEFADNLASSSSAYNFLWESDPNRPPHGVFNQTDCAILDAIITAAEKNGIYLQLCLLTRDHYRFDLSNPESNEYAKAVKAAKNFMKYAVARWGYSTHVAIWEYFNEMDPNAPTQKFHTELGEYLKTIDIFRHLRSTSGWGPAPNHWTHPELDIADLHWYLREAWSTLWKDETMATLDRADFLRKYAVNKPAILGEIGLATDKWEKSNYMNRDKEGIHIHNILWTSVFSGLSATALFWWWDTFDPMNSYHHFRPLSLFVSDIHFNKAELKSSVIPVQNTNILAIALSSKTEMYIWMHDKTVTWWNYVAEKATTPTVKKIELNLPGLEACDYKITWFHTYEGKIINSETIHCDGDKIQITSPAFSKDLACKIIKM